MTDIVRNIEPASQMHSQPILGSDLYDDLLVKFSAQTLSTIETELVLLIKPMEAYRSAEMAIPFINFQVKNKGIQTQNGNNSNEVDTGVMSYLRKELINRAEFYTERLQTFLCKNSSSFPLYVNPTDDSNMKPNQEIGYDAGIAEYDNGYNTYPYNRFFK